MIQFNLSDLLAERGWTVYRLAKEARMREDVVAKYRNNAVKRAVLKHLDAMCATLGCSIGDLMEFVPDKRTRSVRTSTVAAKTRAKKR
jgi:DNA-binding Xre family transcriptional regulator